MTSGNGVVTCSRETTAKYIFFVGAFASASPNQFRIKEMKAFSEVEIGRNVISVTDASVCDPLKCTIGEIDLAHVNNAARFSSKVAEYSFASE